MQDFRGTSRTIIEKPTGYLRLGTIKKFNEDTLSVDVEVDGVFQGSGILKNTQLPVSFYGINGSFIGGYPESGTPVIVAQGEGNVWYVVCFLARDPSARNKGSISNFPEIKKRTITIQSDNTNKIEINEKDGISIGDINNAVIFDPNKSICSNTFDNIYYFTEAHREITGIIKRDKNPNLNLSSSLRLSSHLYDNFLFTIAMDPTSRESHSNLGDSVKNPAFVEKRELIYEFADTYKVLNDFDELQSYETNTEKQFNSNSLPRREGRADAFSLSLISPNYLIETIKGTSVDVYGNILDINRNVINIGITDKSIKNVKTTTKLGVFENVFRNIKRLERKSIAFHFEINSRKELSEKELSSPDINDKTNYTRKRSRFFFDIDKEGLFKANIPASSETGNIPLLVRYENYSTIFPNEKTKDPNDLVLNSENKDLLFESFDKENKNGVISIVDKLGSEISPINRFTNNPIKHGTVYHNILDTCKSFQDNSYIIEYKKTSNIALGRVPAKTNIVSNSIIVDGVNANAGGRSGSLNFDGSLEFNIGANTIDRQSLWLDTQGGIIGNIGRDLRNISAALAFDGEILIQSGGKTPSDDNRFVDKKGQKISVEHIAGAVDIRVFNKNEKEVSVVRIDGEGITITTPSRIIFYSNGDMNFTSKGTINIDGEAVNINKRQVNKDTKAGSI